MYDDAQIYIFNLKGRAVLLLEPLSGYYHGATLPIHWERGESPAPGEECVGLCVYARVFVDEEGGV